MRLRGLFDPPCKFIYGSIRFRGLFANSSTGPRNFGRCGRRLCSLIVFWPVIVLHDCRFALVAVLGVLGFLITVFDNICVPGLQFLSVLVFPGCCVGRCLCSFVAVFVGACVPKMPFWPAPVFPGCRFAPDAVLVVLGFSVTVLVSACVP